MLNCGCSQEWYVVGITTMLVNYSIVSCMDKIFNSLLF